MQLQLISFALCPFVQRAVITLKEKGQSPDIRYIDLMNKPDWFLAISPRGKVPVLVADDTPLFESQAIVEFLEEVVPEPALRAADPIGRARDRAWFALASEDLLGKQYPLDYSRDESVVRASKAAIEKTLDRVEEELEGRDFLSGDGTRFGIADVAMAPFLYRAEGARKRGWYDLFEGRPRIAAWSERILSRESVKTSVPEDFDAQAVAYLKVAGSWMADNHASL